MKNKFLFLFFITFFPVFVTDSYAFGNNYEDDYEDFDEYDSDEPAGLFGAIKRHKILSTLFAVAACGGVAIASNQNLKNSFFSGFDAIKRYVNGTSDAVLQDNLNKVNNATKKPEQKDNTGDNKDNQGKGRQAEDGLKNPNNDQDNGLRRKAARSTSIKTIVLNEKESVILVKNKLNATIDAIEKVFKAEKNDATGSSILSEVEECFGSVESHKKLYESSLNRIFPRNNLGLVINDIESLRIIFRPEANDKQDEELNKISVELKEILKCNDDPKKSAFYRNKLKPILENMKKNTENSLSDTKEDCQIKVDEGRGKWVVKQGEVVASGLVLAVLTGIYYFGSSFKSLFGK